MSDVYSLGLCLIEFLFDTDDNDIEHIRSDPKYLTQYLTKYSPLCTYTELLQRMIEHKYTKRLKPNDLLHHLIRIEHGIND